MAALYAAPKNRTELFFRHNLIFTVMFMITGLFLVLNQLPFEATHHGIDQGKGVGAGFPRYKSVLPIYANDYL